MWRLHRYYLRELLINASITFLVLFAIVVISMVARGIQRAEGGELLDAAIITLFWALDAFPHLLPISYLIATVLTFARAAQDREITAIRSAGISPRVPMLASVLVGLVLAIVGSVGMHALLPEIHFRKYRVVVEVVRNTIRNMGLGSNDDRISVGGVTLTYGQRLDLHNATQDTVYRDCWLYLTDDRATHLDFKSPIVQVDEVRIRWPSEEDLNPSVQFIIMHGSDPLSNQSFDDLRFNFPLRALGDEGRRDERDDDIDSSQLLSELIRDVHQEPTSAIYTLYRRTCFAIMPLLLGPIGFCLALFARDRGRAMALLYALGPLFFFYVGDVFGAKLVRVTMMPVFGWLPAILLILFGTPFCWRELRR